MKKAVIPILCKQEYHLINEKKIIRLIAEESYTRFVLKDRELLASRRIGYYEEKLSSLRFFRCHKSHIINLTKVSRISKGGGCYAVMQNENVVPVSLSRKESFHKGLGVNFKKTT